MEIKVKYDRNDIIRVQSLLNSRAHVIATCQAIDAVTERSVKEGQDEMRAVFDNPSRFTLGAMTRTKTKNGIPLAFVGINWKARYLEPQVKGGPRKRSKSESLLSSQLQPKRYMVPINPTKKRKSELIRILSYLQANTDANANATEASIKKSRYLKKVRYQVETNNGKSRIFAVEQTGSKWRRLIYAGASQPQYEKRFDVEGVVDAVMFVAFDPAYRKAFENYARKHAK